MRLTGLFISLQYINCYISQNGSHVLAVVLTGTEAEVRREEQEISEIIKTREAAELLSSRAENGKICYILREVLCFFHWKSRSLSLKKASCSCDSHAT